MKRTAKEVKLDLSNYTELLNERANLKGKIENGNHGMSPQEYQKCIHRFRVVTSYLNKSYIKMKGL